MSQVQLAQEQQENRPEERSPLLRVSDLTVAFRKVRGLLGSTSSIFTAVNHVGFEIFENEFISLVGESG